MKFKNLNKTYSWTILSHDLKLLKLTCIQNYKTQCNRCLKTESNTTKNLDYNNWHTKVSNKIYSVSNNWNHMIQNQYFIAKLQIEQARNDVIKMIFDTPSLA